MGGPQPCHLTMNTENEIAKIVATRNKTILAVEKILYTEIASLDAFGEGHDLAEAEDFLKMYESEYLVQKEEKDKKL